MKTTAPPAKNRLFAFDLDGTLLDSHKCLTTAALETLAEISLKGFKIVFASGRIRSSINQYSGQCPFPVAVLSLNGAAVYSDALASSETIYNASLSPYHADFLIDYSKKKNIAMNYYFDDRLYALRNEDTLPWINLYHEQTRSTYEYPDSFSLFYGKSPSKIIFIGPPALLDEEQLFFSGLWGDAVYICRTWDYYLEFLNPRANKGAGLTALAAFFQIPMENVIAFGDAPNDIPMLQNAGFSIAVRNAAPEAKIAAKRVSPWTNDEDAVVREWKFLKLLFSL